MKKMVLWDWDGTLINNNEVWYESAAKLFEAQGLNIPSLDALFAVFCEKESWIQTYQEFGITMGREEMKEIYYREYQGRMGQICLSQDARKTLRLLKWNGVIMGIVSRQNPEFFFPILRRLKLRPYFRHIILGLNNKIDAIGQLCLIEGVGRSNCWYVGDMPSDVLQAKEAGVISVAYLTRFIPEEIMLQTEPHFFIRRLEDLPKVIWEMNSRRQQLS